MISPQIIEELKYRNDIEDVISGYVTLKRAGSNLVGLCPFHSEKTPSFYVYPDTQSFYCFGCGAGGDAITFTKKINSILANSSGDVKVGAEENEAFLALRDFMYATVYVDKTAKREEQKVDKLIGELYEYYLTHVDRMSNFYVQLAYQEGRERAVTDYISGMSDEFAIRTFEELFVPQKWHVL